MNNLNYENTEVNTQIGGGKTIRKVSIKKGKGLISVEFEEETLTLELYFTNDTCDKDEVLKKGLDVLWDRHSALSPKNLSKLLFSDEVVRFLKKELKKKYNIKFDEVIIENAVKRIAMESVIIEDFKPIKRRVSKNIDNPINDSQI